MAERHEDLSRHDEMAEAARRVLLEAACILRQEGVEFVLIGGNATESLTRRGREPYPGTIDVDIVIAPVIVRDFQAFWRLRGVLMHHGYRDVQTKCSFRRTVPMPGGAVQVDLDLLTPPVPGRELAPACAFAVKGAELAMDFCEWVEVAGVTPDGRRQAVRVRVASAPALLVMKAHAMAERPTQKNKDAYDIYFCLKHCPGSVEKVADAFRPLRGRPVVEEALSLLEEAFATVGSPGPRMAARESIPADEEDEQRIRRDAYEHVSQLLGILREEAD